MSEIKLYNMDNMLYETEEKFNLIYADCIYESLDFAWVNKYWKMLAPNAIFIVQTDYHTVAEMKLHLDSLENSIFVNWVIYKMEWGGKPRDRFPQKHDDILIYSNGENWHWDDGKILIPKKTINSKSMNPSGRTTKTPCSVFDDIPNFSTVAKERVKTQEGKNIRWQKPVALMRRIMTPFLIPGDKVIDPFMGSGSTGVVAEELNCDFVGIEYDFPVFELGKARLGLE